MITGNINLRQLKHALMVTPKGARAIIIPIEANKLIEGKKGVYLNLVGFDYEDKSDKQYKDTHLLKQSFSKEELAKMTEEERKALPILGNMRVAGSSHGEAEPNGSDEVVTEDDLPF